MHEACEQTDLAEGQLQAMRQQQAEQAPQVAALVSERQQWMLQLQSDRTHASRAIDEAEVMPLPHIAGTCSLILNAFLCRWTATECAAYVPV